MPNFERELPVVGSTLVNLRKIRAVAAPSDARLFYKSSPYPAEAIGDAVNLSLAAGNYLALRAADLGNGRVEKEIWQDELSSVEKKYSGQRPVTSANTTAEEVSLSIIDRVQTLSVDPNHLLNYEFSKANNFGVEDLIELLDREVGVVSPLSGDYLRGMIYRQFVLLTQGRTFPLKLALASNRLRRVMLEIGNLGQPIEEVSDIGIYLDAIESGRTGESVYKATKLAFPEQVVYEPPINRPELVPSKKMIRARNSGLMR